MTDNEIIKALECCTNNKCHTEGCPLIGAEGCMGTLTGSALSLINRQKAEVERLNEKMLEDEKLLNNRVVESVNAVSNAHLRYINRLEQLYKLASMELKTAKAEAIKEFADRLKEKSNKTTWISGGELVAKDYTISREDLDNLVKEMVGEE